MPLERGSTTPCLTSLPRLRRSYWAARALWQCRGDCMMPVRASVLYRSSSPCPVASTQGIRSGVAFRLKLRRRATIRLQARLREHARATRQLIVELEAVRNQGRGGQLTRPDIRPTGHLTAETRRWNCPAAPSRAVGARRGARREAPLPNRTRPRRQPEQGSTATPPPLPASRFATRRPWPRR